MNHLCVDMFFYHILFGPTLQVPLLKEQKWRFGGVQHIHGETPVHRKGPPLCPTSVKLYLVSAASSGWVRDKSNFFYYNFIWH